MKGNFGKKRKIEEDLSFLKCYCMYNYGGVRDSML